MQCPEHEYGELKLHLALDRQPVHFTVPVPHSPIMFEVSVVFHWQVIAYFCLLLKTR